MCKLETAAGTKWVAVHRIVVIGENFGGVRKDLPGAVSVAVCEENHRFLRVTSPINVVLGDRAVHLQVAGNTRR